jgi:hypothetical protein
MTHTCKYTHPHTHTHTHKSTDQPRILVILTIYFIHSWLIRQICIKSKTTCSSVCTCISVLNPIGQTSIQFDTEDFYKNLSRNSKSGQSQATVSGTLHENLSTFTVLTTVQNTLLLNNSAKRTHSCVSMAWAKWFILLATTCTSTRTQRKQLLCFHRTNCSSNAPQYYMYIAYLV